MTTRCCRATVAVLRLPQQTLRRTSKGSFAPSMAELKQRDIESDDSRSGELTDMIDHWVEVTDEWVEHLDAGMGGTALKGADPAGGLPATGSVAGAGAWNGTTD